MLGLFFCCFTLALPLTALLMVLVVVVFLRWSRARRWGMFATPTVGKPHTRGDALTLLVFWCRSPAEAFDAALYRKCVEACALEQDFGEWVDGDRAIIGAKGEPHEKNETTSQTINHRGFWYIVWTVGGKMFNVCVGVVKLHEITTIKSKKHRPSTCYFSQGVVLWYLRTTGISKVGRRSRTRYRGVRLCVRP